MKCFTGVAYLCYPSALKYNIIQCINKGNAGVNSDYFLLCSCTVTSLVMKEEGLEAAFLFLQGGGGLLEENNRAA